MVIPIDNPIKLGDISDEIFCQMLSTAFSDTTKLDDYFLSETEKLEFVRHCTGLMSRLSYVKLLQQQWDYYYHIGTTHNIWTGRISKHVAEKNSICYTYGRSKKVIQQRHVQIEKQLQEIHNTIQLFEKEILFELEQHIDCSSEIKIISSNIHAFAQEHQQRLRDEFENKSVSVSTTTTTDFFHCVLDDIVAHNTSNIYSSIELENLNQLKKYIIHQGIETARAMIEPIIQFIDDKQDKFFFNKNADEHISRIELDMVSAIETRRLHMIERGKYIVE